jgi:hypothetical protein
MTVAVRVREGEMAYGSDLRLEGMQAAEAGFDCIERCSLIQRCQNLR